MFDTFRIVYSTLTHHMQYLMYHLRYFFAYRWYMPDQTEWETRVANLLKAELKRKGVTYAQLVDKLADIGVEEKEANIKNKLSRGKFSAAFMVQCLEAIGLKEVRI